MLKLLLGICFLIYSHSLFAGMSNFDKASEAAIMGPEANELKIFEYKWNVKRADITKSAADISILGQVSYCKDYSLDDQYFYNIRLHNGVVKLIKKQKGYTGGWVELEPTDIFGDYYGEKPITHTAMVELHNKILNHNFSHTPDGRLVQILLMMAIRINPNYQDTLKSNLERAVMAAKKGPELKKLKLYGHEWNIKPMSRTSSGGVMKYIGQISHHYTAGDDDQIYYNVYVTTNGVINKIEFKYASDGKYWTPGVEYMALLDDYIGIRPIPISYRQGLSFRIEQISVKEWEEAVEKIIVQIAIQLP